MSEHPGPSGLPLDEVFRLASERTRKAWEAANAVVEAWDAGAQDDATNAAVEGSIEILRHALADQRRTDLLVVATMDAYVKAGRRGDE